MASEPFFVESLLRYSVVVGRVGEVHPLLHVRQVDQVDLEVLFIVVICAAAQNWAGPRVCYVASYTANIVRRLVYFISA